MKVGGRLLKMCQIYKNGRMMTYDCGREEHGFGSGLEATMDLGYEKDRSRSKFIGSYSLGV